MSMYFKVLPLSKESYFNYHFCQSCTVRYSSKHDRKFDATEMYLRVCTHEDAFQADHVQPEAAPVPKRARASAGGEPRRLSGVAINFFVVQVICSGSGGYIPKQRLIYAGG
jgi:hypothetical protein